MIIIGDLLSLDPQRRPLVTIVLKFRNEFKGKKTQKRIGIQRRLAVTQNSVKTHLLLLVGKTHHQLKLM